MMKKFLIVIMVLMMMLAVGCAARVDDAQSVEVEPTPTIKPTPIPLVDPQITNNVIPDEMFLPSSQAGETFTVQYQTYDYSSEELTPVTKSMMVYLPYGYDVEEKYDVVFLMHTSGGDENFWLMYDHPYKDKSIRLQNVLDNMIAKGLSKPVIVMTPCGYLTDEAIYYGSEKNFSQFAEEFRNDIIPFVQENYAVYIDRDHYAFIGASYGAYLENRSIFGPNFDLVSWYGYAGGGQLDAQWLLKCWRHSGWEYNLNGLMITEGMYDDRGPVEMGYYEMNAYFDNVVLNMIEETGHDFVEWDNCVYNSLQMFFR